MQNTSVKSKRKRLQGVVVSNAMDKTLVVSVNRLRKHQKYHLRYWASTRYKVHDEKNQFRVGDAVIIEECRPFSKEKRWRVVQHIGGTGQSASGIKTGSSKETKN